MLRPNFAIQFPISNSSLSLSPDLLPSHASLNPTNLYLGVIPHQDCNNRPDCSEPSTLELATNLHEDFTITEKAHSTFDLWLKDQNPLCDC